MVRHPLGSAHLVIYGNGLDNDNNDAFPEIANLAYTDIIVNFADVDNELSVERPASLTFCPATCRHCTNAGKTVLVSFGNSSSADYKACYYGRVDNLASQIARYVTSNGFDGVISKTLRDLTVPGNYDGVAFLTQLTDDLYSQLPQY